MGNDPRNPFTLRQLVTGFGMSVSIILGLGIFEGAVRAQPRQANASPLFNPGNLRLSHPTSGQFSPDGATDLHVHKQVSETYIRPAIVCPSDLTDLTPLLFRDLPSYANRVSTRAQVLDRSFNPRGVVIIAAQSESDEALNDALPIDSSLPENEDITAFSFAQTLEAHHLIPLFFTTLERQYVDDQAVRIQHYHWAFLSQTHAKKQPQWHLAMMFSRVGDYPDDSLTTPPRESRQGSIGQAIQLWLRDCNAGAVAGES